MRNGEDIETRKLGETLEQLDAALLPQTPSEPKRPVIIGLGAALGLFVGLVVAGAREMKDTSLKNLKDVRAYTKMPILGSIPLLENDLVVRRRRRIAWLGWDRRRHHRSGYDGRFRYLLLRQTSLRKRSQRITHEPSS